MPLYQGKKREILFNYTFNGLIWLYYRSKCAMITIGMACAAVSIPLREQGRGFA